MPAIRLETTVPEGVYNSLLAHGWSKERLTDQLRHLLAMVLFRNRTLSLGKAAQLAGLSRGEFIDLLGANDIPVINYSDESLAEELNSVDKMATELGG